MHFHSYLIFKENILYKTSLKQHETTWNNMKQHETKNKYSASFQQVVEGIKRIVILPLFKIQLSRLRVQLLELKLCKGLCFKWVHHFNVLSDCRFYIFSLVDEIHVNQMLYQ